MKLVLKVEHEGIEKMVGKIFPDPETGRSLFLHAESGSQKHINTDSPGGIDACVLKFLGENGVEVVHHYNRNTRMLWVTIVEYVATKGIKEPSGGRNRYFLGDSYWVQYPLDEYVSPWITDIKVLRDEPEPWPTESPRDRIPVPSQAKMMFE